MSRPRKILSMQEGDLTKKRQEEIQQQEDAIKTGDDQLDKIPKWLRDSVAKKEFKRLVKQFKELSIISNLDLNNLGAYCNAYSSYIESTEALKGQPLIINYTNKGGATNLIENPLIKIQMKYSDEMKKYSSLVLV